ncbi:MAG TPA: EAL domain-containing protein [Terracidiphilus sp.]|jgi:diguanylate cyclase (GGDEF)-like protein/PAS domain S-box-containing protein
MNDRVPSADSERTFRELAWSLQESQRIAGLGSYVLDLKTLLWTSSDVLDQIFGIGPPYQRNLEGWLAIVHPEDRQMMSDHFASVREFNLIFDKEYRIIRQGDRSQRWVHGRGRFEPDETGRPVIMRGTIQDITDRKRVEADLRQNEEFFELFIQHAPAALAMFDLNMRYIAASRRWMESFGLQGRDIIGQSHYEVFPDIPARWVSIHRRILGGETMKNDEDPFERADGSVQWLRWEGRPWLTGTGAVGGIVIFTEDITVRKQSEARLQLAASVFTHASEGIVISDHSGIILDVNDAFTEITGYTREEAVGRKTNLLQSGRHGKEFYDNMWRDLIEAGHWSGEIWNRAKDGRIFAETLNIIAVRDKNEKIERYVALFSDITSEKDHEQTLQRIAQYDLLTGLPNRALLRDRLHHAMLQATRRGNVLAVVCLDLDDFKSVNDRHGHAVGDLFLTTVAHRIKLAISEKDTLARLGGDEFIAVLLDLDNPDQSLHVVKQLLHAASQHVRIGNITLSVSASAGISFYPQAAEVAADQLLRQAGQALYQSKIRGKGRYHIFDSSLDLSVRGHHEDLERIHRALAQNEFVLYYQPKMNMATGAIEGAEALIRWNHPERGLLLPSDFLPVVEGHSLALTIGEWVIETVLSQMETWREAGLDIPVSANISAQQLQHADFSTRLNAILADHPRIDPSRLEIEVLESAALPDMAQVSQVIHTCGKLGVSFALDDFGTGYSSLAFLKRLPVDVLKIDQTFVHDMLDDPEDLTIVEGMLGLATAFRRQAVAEGVETVEQGLLLLRLGCQIAQGFGIARPMPPDALPAWLKSWTPHPQWASVVALDPADRPLLYAAAEHSAWVGAIEAFLEGKRRVPPSLDVTQCRLGAWISVEANSTAARIRVFGELDLLHQELHNCGARILELNDARHTSEALNQLPQLHEIRDRLNSELKARLKRE